MLENGVFTIHPAQGDLSLIPAQRTYRIHLRGVEAACRVSHPGAYDSASRTYTLETIALTPEQSFAVKMNAARA